MSHNPPPLGFHPMDPCLSNWMFNAGNAVFFLSLSLDLHYFLFGLQSNSQRVFEPSWVSQRGPKQAHSGSLCWCLVGKGARGAPQASPRGSWSPAEPNYAKWQGTCPSSAGFAGDKAPAAARWGPCATLQAGDGSCDGLQPSDGTESSPQHNPFRSVFGVPAGWFSRHGWVPERSPAGVGICNIKH